MFGGVIISHFLKISSDEVFDIYNAKFFVTNNGFFKLIKYKNSNKRLKKGYEDSSEINGSKNADFQKSAINEDVVENQITKQSLSRTRSFLRLYVNHNIYKFHSFITLTFKDEVTDISSANKKFQNFIRSWRRLKGDDFYYIGVPEYQKNGRVHYHILTSLVCGVDIDKKINKRVKSEGKFINLKFYDIKYWGYGFSSALDLNEVDDKFNACAYMGKYLYKDFDSRLYGHIKLLKSNNLELPTFLYLNMSNDDVDLFLDTLEKKELEISSHFFVSDKPYLPTYTSFSSFCKDDINTVIDLVKDSIVFTD